jgi:hypothetical protein
MLLAISIIDRNTLDISSYEIFSGDRVTIKDKVYSDKPPGVSFFLTPIYFTLKTIFREFFGKNDYILIPEPQSTTTTYYIASGLERSILLSIIFGVMLFSSTVGASSVVIFKRILNLFFKKRTSLILSVILGLSTLIFPYSTVLIGSSFSLLLILLAFYALQKNYKQKFLIGVLLGLSVVIDYTSIIVISVLISLTLINFKTLIEKLKFLFSFIFGMLPLFIYSFLVFNNPFGFIFYILTFYYSNIFPCGYTEKYFEYCVEPFAKSFSSELVLSFFRLLHLLIFPYRGLFFYNPVLVFFFLSLFFSYSKNKLITYLSLVIFIFSSISFSFYGYWFGGSSFGPRYLTVSIPFLILPIGYFLEDMRIMKIKKVVIIVLFFLCLISTFNMLLSTSANWEGVIPIILDTSKAYLYGTWYNKEVIAFSFRVLNPLYDHYLPAFMENGPRSRLLEYLLLGEIPDIRDSINMPRREIYLFSTPFGIITVKVPFLAIFLILLFFVFIWHYEFSKNRFGKLLPMIALFIVIILIFIFQVKVRDVVLGRGWYPQATKEFVTWSGGKGEIHLFWPSEKKAILNITLTNYKDNIIEVYLNENLVGSYFSPENIIEIVRLKKGYNRIVINSKSGCEIPFYSENNIKCLTYVECRQLNISIFKLSSDFRCLSFGLANISLVPIEGPLSKNFSLFYGSGFYLPEKEGRWLSDRVLMYVYSNKQKKVFLNINFTYSYSKKVKVTLNNRSKIYYYGQLLFIPLDINKGLNIVELNFDRCVIPAYFMNNSKDYRCLSSFVNNITIIDFDELESGVYFSSGWFAEEEKGRWMTTSSTIYLAKLKNASKILLELQSLRQNRQLLIEANNISHIYEIPSKESKDILLVLPSTDLIEISLKTNPPCEIPERNDNRCLSLLLKKLVIN